MKLLTALVLALILSISTATAQTLHINTAGELKQFNLSQPGSYVGTHFTANWNLFHTVDETGKSTVQGQVTVKNITAEARRFRVLANFQKRGGLTAPVTYGGVIALKGIANANGALYSCPVGNTKLVAPAINGIFAPVPAFWCPFSMSAGGASTMQTFSQIQPQIFPQDVKSIGVIADVMISDGDSLEIKPNLYFHK